MNAPQWIAKIYAQDDWPMDWPKFRDDATALLEHYRCKYYIKEDLRKAS